MLVKTKAPLTSQVYLTDAKNQMITPSPRGSVRFQDTTQDLGLHPDVTGCPPSLCKVNPEMNVRAFHSGGGALNTVCSPVCFINNVCAIILVDLAFDQPRRPHASYSPPLSDQNQCLKPDSGRRHLLAKYLKPSFIEWKTDACARLTSCCLNFSKELTATGHT